MKKVKLFFAVSVASAVLSITSFAGEWKQDTSGWWYQNDDGSYNGRFVAKVGKGLARWILQLGKEAVIFWPRSLQEESKKN